ncbi:lantibiotic dehydratase family protein [Streptomyces diastatochromogenes]|nr:lantibiotic dehydratase family protein [Streptomyces diastatochromogenes]
MASPSHTRLYRHTDTALLRAAPHVPAVLPPWPVPLDSSPSTVESWADWAEDVWAHESLAVAVEHASPVLARQVRELVGGKVTDLRHARRVCRALGRYARRTAGRATPFGLFAGVTSAGFGTRPFTQWGGEHQAWARADAAWLSDVIRQLEALPELLPLLPVTVTNTAFVRGDRLVVPYPPDTDRSAKSAAEVSLRYTMPVRIAVETAREPVRGELLVQKILAEMAQAPAGKVHGLLGSLVRRGVLLTSLHAPLGVFDALGHLVDELDAVGADRVDGAAGIVARLRSVRALFAEHNRAPAEARSALCARARDAMLSLSTVVEQPVALDSRLDCTVVLPDQVAREAETAATVLARLSPYPAGAPAWNAYHSRFFERYGIGALVPLTDLVNPDVGIGFPRASWTPSPNAPMPCPYETSGSLALLRRRRSTAVRRSSSPTTCLPPWKTAGPSGDRLRCTWSSSSRCKLRPRRPWPGATSCSARSARRGGPGHCPGGSSICWNPAPAPACGTSSPPCP